MLSFIGVGNARMERSNGRRRAGLDVSDIAVSACVVMEPEADDRLLIHSELGSGKFS